MLNPNIEPKIKFWDEHKKCQFVQNIRQSDVDKLLQRVNEVSPENANVETIKNIVTKIEILFTSNSKETFGVVSQKSYKNYTNKKWFNAECRNARNRYHYTRKIYNKLKIVSKEYKNIISQNVEKIKKYKNWKIAKFEVY